MPRLPRIRSFTRGAEIFRSFASRYAVRRLHELRAQYFAGMNRKCEGNRAHGYAFTSMPEENHLELPRIGPVAGFLWSIIGGSGIN